MKEQSVLPTNAPQKAMPKSPKDWLTAFLPVLLVVIIDLAGWLIAPDAFSVVAQNSWEYLREAIVILIPVAVMMGLFEVWIPKSLIAQYLGHTSGWQGVALAFLFGTLPTGPIYVAFPIAAMLLQKGARPLNVVILLNTWAALKIPQLMVETQFLGTKFMLVRLALTVPSAFLIGWAVEKFVHWTDK
jgi:uncharacterized membrane protein YraQ (UPF0718 family)